VTLIVGIVCKDAVVLAADSQTTYYPSKILGTNKISEVKFANGSALVAEAGFVTLSNEAVGIFRKKAVTTEIKNEETIANLCKESVFEVRRNQIGLYAKRRYSLVEWQNFFRDQQQFFLTVAYYHQNKPHLYDITLSECVLRPPQFNFIVSGIGETVGNYVLKEEHDLSGGFDKMSSELASVIAIKVACVAADYVDGCGRPIMAAMIRKPSPPAAAALETAGWGLDPGYSRPEPEAVIFPQSKVDEIEKIISSVERKTKAAQNKRIHAALQRQTEKAFNELMKSAGLKIDRQNALASAMQGIRKQNQSKGRSLRNRNK
jgi:20S proteasome alpha/beta subunit